MAARTGRCYPLHTSAIRSPTTNWLYLLGRLHITVSSQKLHLPDWKSTACATPPFVLLIWTRRQVTNYWRPPLMTSKPQTQGRSSPQIGVSYELNIVVNGCFKRLRTLDIFFSGSLVLAWPCLPSLRKMRIRLVKSVWTSR